MKKKFLSNLVLLIVLNLMIKPFWFFGIQVAVQNRVGEEMFGFYFALFNFAFIMNILLDLGITNFNNRSIARDHDRLAPFLSKIIPIRILLSLVYAIVVFVAAAIVGYGAVEFRLLIFLVINQFMAAFILYLRSNISGIQRFRTDSLLSVLDRTLMIIFTGILLWGNVTSQPYRIEWFVYTQSVSYLLTATVVLFIVLKHSGKLKLTLNTRQFIDILRQSYPFAILILLMSFFYRIDSVMIERMLPGGDRQAGIYAQSFTIMDALTQFAILFSGLLLPMFSKMIKTGERVSDLIHIASSLLISASLLVAVFGQFFGGEIITMLYHEADGQSAGIFRILMFSFTFLCLSNIFGPLLTANRNLYQLNFLALSTVILNVLLNLVLIPRQQALGAAWSNLVSQAYFAAGQILLSYRYIHLKPDLRFTLRAVLYGTVLMICGYFSARYLPTYQAMIILVVVAVITAMVSGLVRPFELVRVFTGQEEE